MTLHPRGGLCLGEEMVPVVKIMNWEQLSPVVFFTKISLLPDGSIRWLPE